MFTKIKNFFKKDVVVDVKSYRRPGFLKAAQTQKARSQRYVHLNLSQLMYHPAVTEEDFDKLDKFIEEIETKCKAYLTGN